MCDDYHMPPLVPNPFDHPEQLEYTICCCICGAELYRARAPYKEPICEECKYGKGEDE